MFLTLLFASSMAFARTHHTALATNIIIMCMVESEIQIETHAVDWFLIRIGSGRCATDDRLVLTAINAQQNAQKHVISVERLDGFLLAAYPNQTPICHNLLKQNTLTHDVGKIPTNSTVFWLYATDFGCCNGFCHIRCEQSIPDIKNDDSR